MVMIRTVTWVNAPVERCFRLATSVDFLLASSKSKNIKAIAGVKSGSLGQGDTVTWQGGMFGLGRIHTSRIEVLRPFHYVRETMVDGAFQYYEHDRHFAAMDDGTRVKDEVRFSLRLGPLGRLMETIMLRRQMTTLLKWRSEILKETAESDGWKRFLEENPEMQMVESQGQSGVGGSKVEIKSHFLAHQRVTTSPK
jgi:ligand-binding SRPBCC domain-containing protein